MHHLVKRRCFEILTGLNNTKEAYHESRAVYLSNLVSPKCQMLPEKVRSRFVFARYLFGYLRDISHVATHEVTTTKSVQTHPLLKTYNTYADLGSSTLKNSSEK